MSLVERASQLFTSIAAKGALGVASADLATIADEHDLTPGDMIDALAFLEANGMVAVQSFVSASPGALERFNTAKGGQG